MRVTAFTRETLAYRRQRRELTRRGYEAISCCFGIGELWQLDRGWRTSWRIVDVVLGVDGKTIYALAVPPRQADELH